MALVDLLKIPPVRSFLLSGKVLAEFRDVATKNNLPVERAVEFLDLCNAVINGDLPMTEVPGIVAQAFAKDEETAKKISADIFGYRILPLEPFISGVKEQITAWGGKLEDYPNRPIGKEQITAYLWAKRLADLVALNFSEVLLKRLGLLLEGRLRGDKDADALKTFFGRPLTIGGLALPKEKVEALLSEVQREAPYMEIVSEEEWKKILDDKARAEAAENAEEEPEEAEAPPVETTTPSIPLEGGAALEIAPVKDLAAEVPSEVSFVPDQLKLAIDSVVDAVKEIIFAENIPLDKFKAIAEKNIRGVREPNQTRDILEKDFKLAGADLRLIVDALAAGKKKYDGEKKAVEVEKIERLERKEGEEVSVMDQKFVKLTKTLPNESVEPIMPGARVSAARETAVPLDKQAVPLKPRLAKAELTVGSVAPKAPDRKMTDIVAASRLMGPVDQLKNMSTVEFRRLASDPAEAAKRVEDLLAALMATSYEERVSGIAAWRKSPMNQLYLKISEEALGAGMTIPDLCSKWRKEGKDCLSPAEIKAVVSLNAKLRF